MCKGPRNRLFYETLKRGQTDSVFVWEMYLVARDVDAFQDLLCPRPGRAP